MILFFRFCPQTQGTKAGDFNPSIAGAVLLIDDDSEQIYSTPNTGVDDDTNNDIISGVAASQFMQKGRKNVDTRDAFSGCFALTTTRAVLSLDDDFVTTEHVTSQDGMFCIVIYFVLLFSYFVLCSPGANFYFLFLMFVIFSRFCHQKQESKAGDVDASRVGALLAIDGGGGGGDEAEAQEKICNTADTGVNDDNNNNITSDGVGATQHVPKGMPQDVRLQDGMFILTICDVFRCTLDFVCLALMFFTYDVCK